MLHSIHWSVNSIANLTSENGVGSLRSIRGILIWLDMNLRMEFFLE